MCVTMITRDGGVRTGGLITWSGGRNEGVKPETRGQDKMVVVGDWDDKEPSWEEGSATKEAVSVGDPNGWGQVRNDASQAGLLECDEKTSGSDGAAPSRQARRRPGLCAKSRESLYVGFEIQGWLAFGTWVLRWNNREGDQMDGMKNGRFCWRLLERRKRKN